MEGDGKTSLSNTVLRRKMLRCKVRVIAESRFIQDTDLGANTRGRRVNLGRIGHAKEVPVAVRGEENLCMYLLLCKRKEMGGGYERDRLNSVIFFCCVMQYYY